MKISYEVDEIQNDSIIPWTFPVSQQYPTKDDAEAAAYAMYYGIMSAAVQSQVSYHGARIIKMEGINQIILEGRIIDRTGGA